MRLIVTEKDTTAKRIADILSKGTAGMEKKGGTGKGGIPVYSFSQNGSPTRIIGLKGHILKVDFPEGYDNWEKIDPVELVSADIQKTPILKSVLKALQGEAKDASDVVIATDFDREGELIGVDAINMIREVNPDVQVKRARFSALTDSEVKEAFSDLKEPYYEMASAGEARQDIDLIWGAALTRTISLASSRLGKNFLSVGRVQSPTLVLLSEREQERMAFKSTPYWQITAVFDKDGQQFEALHKTERFTDEKEAKSVSGKLGKQGTVSSAERKERSVNPPTPFNTTSFLAAASSIGFSASNAMRIAESLYISGWISYPRTDNTHYPPSLNIRDVIDEISSGPFADLCAKVSAQKEIKPTIGKKKATDHPPVYPTGAATQGKLDERAWKIYELVVRRFLATCMPKAKFENIKAVISVNGEDFIAKGERVLSQGWLESYYYPRRKEVVLPDIIEGEALPLVSHDMVRKETQPPNRYGQGSLIQEMEKLGLGTKATRHNIIQNLYDRAYIMGDPITPTKLGMAVAESLKQYAVKISTPDMTAELEQDMDAIAEGTKDRQIVVEKSRGVLTTTVRGIQEHGDKIKEEIWKGVNEDRVIAKCPQCGNDLLIRKARKSGKRFIGCSGYPECRVTYSLPPFGMIQPAGDSCPDCGAPKLKVINKGKPPWVICPNMNCPSKKKE